MTRLFRFRTVAFVFSIALIAIHSPLVRADDFFSLTAVGNGSSSVTVGGANVISLTNNLINQKDQFASLAGQNVTGTLTYGGVQNALVFSENSAQTSATLTIPITGFSKTFTGTSSSDLQSQIEKFLKSDGAGAYSNFIQAVDAMSPVASIDGNPQASTALIADDAFYRFGIAPAQDQSILTSNHSSAFAFHAIGGTARADQLNSDYAGLSFGGALQLFDNLSLALATTLDYRSTAGSEVYTVAEEIGLPITIIRRPTDADGLAWQVTPWGFGGLSASYEQATGALLVGGGATSSLSLRFGDLTLALADQADYNGNVGVTVDQYNFDVPIDQWIVKNGAQAILQPNGESLILDAGIAYSDFLRSAAVRNYWTATAGAGLQLGRQALLHVDFQSDFARHFTSTGGEISLVFSY